MEDAIQQYSEEEKVLIRNFCASVLGVKKENLNKSTQELVNEHSNKFRESREKISDLIDIDEGFIIGKVKDYEVQPLIYSPNIFVRLYHKFRNVVRAYNGTWTPRETREPRKYIKSGTAYILNGIRSKPNK